MNRIKKITITSLLSASLLFSGAFGGVTAFADTATIYSGSGASVNMRSGAGTDYERVCSIPDGATVEIGTLTDGWYEVSYNGYTGYVLADLVNTGSSTVSDTSEESETSSESSYESSETETSSESEETTSEEGDIVINGVSYTVDNDFYADEMPEGFSYTAVLVNGEDTNAAYSEELELYLVHLVSADGTEGWFVHDENVSDYFYPYVTVGSEDSFLIVKQTEEEALDGYTKISLPFDSFGVLYGFQQDGEMAEHYIVYGMTNLGDEGWFIVDTFTESYISSNGMIEEETESEVVEESTEEVSDNEVFLKRICAGLGLVIVVLLVLLIASLIRGRKSGEFIDDDEDYDDESGEDEYISYDDDFEKYEDEELAGEDEKDMTIPVDIDLDIVKEAASEEPVGRYSNQLKKDEELSKTKAHLAEARHRAYGEISAADRPDNIDIIDLN